jgi:diguanylate cyclase (GGDEF)-like protein
MVKADPRYQFIPLIIVTGDESTIQLQRAYDAGVVDFVRKPVNRVELFARINAAAKSWWMETQLRQLAHYDSLTGLVNRSLLMDRLEQAIRSAARCKSTVELIFVDLDRFKPLNDTLGHKAGDLALQETAQRLRGLVRESDTVARLGGDEFVILLSGSQHNDQGSSRLNEMINDAFDEPFNLNGESWQLGASTGVARYPDMGTTAQELLLIADRSMYVQKRCHHEQMTRSADAG